MTRYLLPLAALLSLLAIGFMNCSPAGNCSPANCGGCCDSAGMCITSTTPDACGRLGEACTTCSAPTNICMAGVCTAGMTMGGGSGGGTGGGSGGGTGGGSGGGSGGGTGGGSGGGGGGGGCVVFDFSQAQAVFAEYDEPAMGDPNHFAVIAQNSATAGRGDFIFFESWYFGNNTNPAVPRTNALPSPAMAGYWQCYDCLVLREACDQSAQNCTHVYYAQGGSLNVTQADRNVTVGTFAATATNVNFVEWNLAQAVDAPVPGGLCATVATASINMSWDNTPDAGPVDAGTDAGMVTDAGMDTDAGMEEDAGMEVDAGMEEDAGMEVDAGMEEDAGMEVDAGMEEEVDAGP